MGGRLRELQNKIFFGECSNEQWEKINDEVSEEFRKATDQEREEFLDSGAGDLLAQIMEYMD